MAGKRRLSEGHGVDMQFAAGKARAVSRLLARYADVGGRAALVAAAVVDEMKLRKNNANLEQGGGRD